MNPSIELIQMKLRQLRFLLVVTFVVKSRPEEGSGIGAGEVNWHEGLISVNRHKSIFIAIHEYSGIFTAVSDLVENSRLKRLIGVVVADLRGVVVAVERLALADMFSALLALAQQHLHDRLEDFSQPIAWRSLQLLSVVDVLVDAVDARHAVFTRVWRHDSLSQNFTFWSTQKKILFWILFNCVARLNAPKTSFVLNASSIRSILLYIRLSCLRSSLVLERRFLLASRSLLAGFVMISSFARSVIAMRLAPTHWVCFEPQSGLGRWKKKNFKAFLAMQIFRWNSCARAGLRLKFN